MIPAPRNLNQRNMRSFRACNSRVFEPFLTDLTPIIDAKTYV